MPYRVCDHLTFAGKKKKNHFPHPNLFPYWIFSCDSGCTCYDGQNSQRNILTGTTPEITSGRRNTVGSKTSASMCTWMPNIYEALFSPFVPRLVHVNTVSKQNTSINTACCNSLILPTIPCLAISCSARFKILRNYFPLDQVKTSIKFRKKNNNGVTITNFTDSKIIAQR